MTPALSHAMRFATVGVSVALVYVALYVGLLALGWVQPLANLAAFTVAVFVQYIAQAAVTFRAPIAAPRQIGRFATMIGLGFATSALVTGVVAPAFGLPDALAAGLVTLVLPVQNYVFMSRWVFQPAPTREVQEQ